jgi:glutamine amidotransferase
MVTVGIVDLGIGNFSAMAKMVRELDGDPRRLTDPVELGTATHIILPGVGAFDYAAGTLDERGWREPLMTLFESGSRPVLCVCVGMQLLGESSEEGSGVGLGWIRGCSVRFHPVGGSNLKVPHMGWNTVRPERSDPLFSNGDTDDRFYFVHSYHVACDNPEDVVATSTHGETFAAAVRRDQVWGVQFHPEKSHRYGTQLLHRFLGISC